MTQVHQGALGEAPAVLRSIAGSVLDVDGGSGIRGADDSGAAGAVELVVKLRHGAVGGDLHFTSASRNPCLLDLQGKRAAGHHPRVHRGAAFRGLLWNRSLGHTVAVGAVVELSGDAMASFDTSTGTA